jgi:TolB-like protein/Tfp pilus assembly protein PilF/predicted Ser/Thr protein kinase
MTPERWQQIEELYYAALERDATERAAFLDEACGGDEALRQEVELLLASHEQAGSFLASPALEVAAQMVAEDQAGSVVGRSIGHYQILSLLGVGGMGEVYLAEDTRLDRKVALKLLPVHFTQDADRMRRFVQEAKAASAFSHPNVAHIYEIGEAEGVTFIAMEYVEGQTLDAKIGGRPLETAEILDITVQVADALEEAHSKGTIHRDIKPGNVMVTARGQVKVLDFGLAKMTRQEREGLASDLSTQVRTQPGMLMGTVAYMSPEQALGHEVDHRTDIFSLGVVMYEMATGQRPFTGTTTGETLDQIIHAEPEAIARFNSNVPAELERIIRKCLEKDRERRYQSARELLTDLKNLKRALESGDVALAVAGKVEWRRLLTSPKALALAAVVVLAVAVLIYALLFRGAPAPPQPEITSLAVLPLENLSGDPAQEYFADGMTEALITDLGKISALRVISRTSVMAYKGARKPLPDIARELKVDAVVAGSVLRSGDQVRITAQLVEAATERQLWSESYERDLRDILALQSEIARAISGEVRVRLTPNEQMQLVQSRPVNPEAYDHYLRGRFYANRQNKADNETTIKMLERAVALDPTFAAAQAELALAYVWRFFLFTPGEKQWEEKAFMEVEKALSLDPALAGAHLARGRLLWTPANHFPHEKAIQEYRRALALNPNLDEAQNQLALVYNHIGAFDHALQELHKAVAINPINTLAQFRIGQTLLFQGKYEPALTALRRIPRDVNPALVGFNTAMALLHLGRRDEAAAIVEEFLADYPEGTDGGLFTSVQAMLAALAGEENKAESKIRSAIEKGKGFGHFHHTAYNIACAYSLMKKAEPAMKWLETAADDGFPCYPLFERDPHLDPIRRDPRFVAFMDNLKKQWEHYKAIL